MILNVIITSFFTAIFNNFFLIIFFQLFETLGEFESLISLSFSTSYGLHFEQPLDEEVFEFVDKNYGTIAQLKNWKLPNKLYLSDDRLTVKHLKDIN